MGEVVSCTMTLEALCSYPCIRVLCMHHILSYIQNTVLACFFQCCRKCPHCLCPFLSVVIIGSASIHSRSFSSYSAMSAQVSAFVKSAILSTKRMPPSTLLYITLHNYVDGLYGLLVSACIHDIHCTMVHVFHNVARTHVTDVT